MTRALSVEAQRQRYAPAPRSRFASTYRSLQAELGGSCPIEAGLLVIDGGGLADNECRHGNLPTDRVQRCACWSEALDA